MNYLFGRFMYDFIKLCCKGMYYFFVGIVWIMYYCVFYAFMAIYFLCKISVFSVVELFKFIKKKIIKLKGDK